MNIDADRGRWRRAALLVVAVCCVAPASAAVSFPDTSTAAAGADTTSAFPEKRRSRPAWEYVVNAPFELAYLPVGLTLETAKQGVRFVSGHHVVAHVREFLISDDGRTGVVPIFSPTHGGGARFFHRGWFSPNSKFTVHARAATHLRQDYAVELKRVVVLDGAMSVGSFAGYEHDSDEHFFGVGMGNDPDADESDYTRERARVEVRAGKPVGERFLVTSAASLEHNNILAGDEAGHRSTGVIYTGTQLPGARDSHVRLAGARVAAELDTRDAAGSPSRGFLVTAGGGYVTQVDGDRYGFWKFDADARTYLDLFYRRVVMLRAAVQSTERVDGRDVPFYHLSELGSHGTVRGFSNGRFRAMDAALASIEYSWPVAQKGDVLLFADAGEVFNGFSTIDLDAVEVGWGGGLRIHSHDQEVVRFEFGKSRDEWRLYFTLN